MNSPTNSPPGNGLTTTQRLISVIASIGFAFDIHEFLMLPLIVGPALAELISAVPGSEPFAPRPFHQ